MSEYLEVGTEVRYIGSSLFDKDALLEIIEVDAGDELCPYLVYSPDEGYDCWVATDEVEPW